MFIMGTRDCYYCSVIWFGYILSVTNDRQEIPTWNLARCHLGEIRGLVLFSTPV